MKIKTIAVALLSAFIAVGAFAKGPKGGPTRLDPPLHLDSSFEKVVKGDHLVIACKTCDAMSVKAVESDTEVPPIAKRDRKYRVPLARERPESSESAGPVRPASLA